jgi:hypothetical protein
MKSKREEQSLWPMSYIFSIWYSYIEISLILVLIEDDALFIDMIRDTLGKGKKMKILLQVTNRKLV